MDPKVFLAIALLLHAPVVLGCITFYASSSGSSGNLAITFADSQEVECTYYGGPNDGSDFNLDCNEGYSAVFDSQANGDQGQVSFESPFDSDVFPTTLSSAGTSLIWYGNYACG